MSPDSSPNTAGMVAARRRDSETKRARVLTALQHLQDQDTPITFAAVARQAGVSTWLVYAPGIREHIDQARDRQQVRTANTGNDDALARGLHTDLALARDEIRKLRAERDYQQQQLRRALGARLDDLTKAELNTRVDELTRANTELTATVEHYRRDNESLQSRITELEDDLTAARTSLRRMIRTENQPAEH